MLFALWLLAASATQLPADAPPRGGAEPRLAGAATPISPTLCEPLAPEHWRCAGLAGIDVGLFGSEAARRLALGGDRTAFPPLPVPGRLARTLDWRTDRDGQPIAATVGWRAAEGSAELVLVLRPARDGAPSCLSALAGPDADPDALVARRFRCGLDQPVLSGTIPPDLRAALEPWVAALPR